MAAKDFIALVKPGAQEVQRKTGMFASVTIAQAAWETGYGYATPKDIYSGAESYNLFGRKASGNDAYVTSNTWEVYNGKRVEIKARFKKFNSYADSILDRSTFLLLPWYQKACKATNPFDAARFLIDTGYPGLSYATDPNYVKGIISMINTNNLQQYDLKKEGFNIMSKDEANFILDILGAYWKDMNGAKDIQDEVHRVANVLRKEVGIPEE